MLKLLFPFSPSAARRCCQGSTAETCGRVGLFLSRSGSHPSTPVCFSRMESSCVPAGGARIGLGNSWFETTGLVLPPGSRSPPLASQLLSLREENEVGLSGRECLA